MAIGKQDMKPQTQTVYLGLGANVGHPEAQLKEAVERLKAAYGVDELRVSSLYRTKPWGMENQPDFLNACACFQTWLTPEQVLETCLTIERAMGRERTQKWGPRTIDVDVLLYGEANLNTPTLTLPHPHLTERLFVLEPLFELAPALQVKGKPLEHWINAAKAN